MNDSASSIQQTLNDWSLPLGRFILMFGSIEETTYVLLDTLPTERIFNSVSILPLGKRIELLNEIIQNKKQLQTKTKEDLKNSLDEVITLAKQRNILAHNPLSFEASRNLTGSIKISEKIKSILRPQNNITLPELIALSQKTETLAFRLNDLLNDVLAQTNL